ncbi:UNVERIFIED_CONTAM: hypothetical protein K2H54_046106 [Gekko kuhli]
MRASKNRASVLGARHRPHLPSFGPAPSLKYPDTVQCLGRSSCCVPAAFLSAQRPCRRRQRTRHGGGLFSRGHSRGSLPGSASSSGRPASLSGVPRFSCCRRGGGELWRAVSMRPEVAQKSSST